MKAIQSLKRLVLRLKPTDFSGNVRFGFEDPAVTGKTLAVLSVTAPFFEGNLEVEPEFQEEILEGELLIRRETYRMEIYSACTGTVHRQKYPKDDFAY